jgi:hypothetical protein
MIRIVTASLAFALMAPNCQGPTPPPPPEPDVVVVPPDTHDAAPAPAQDASLPDAGPLDPCQAACLNLKALGCLSSDVPTCTDVCRRVQDAGLTDLKPACLAAATSKAGARGCGSVRCP